MSSSWPIKSLDDVLVRTETVDPAQSPESEFEYVDVSAVSNETFQITETQRLQGKDAPSRARRLIRRNDVLFATVRPTLQRVAVVPAELDGQVCSTGYFVMRPKPELNHRWLFYSLFTESFMGQMAALQKGASYPAVNDSDVRAQGIPIPPFAEQQRIVAILDEAFAAIATAKANTEKNVANARAVFESHRQRLLTGRGNGWNEKPFAELCDVKHGFAFKSEYFTDRGEYVLLTPGNFFESGGYRDRGDKQKYYQGEIPTGFVLNKGDLLVAMTEQAPGLLGSPILVPESNRFLHNQRLGLVQKKPGVPWLNEYFFHVFNLPQVRNAIHESGTGVKVRHTSPTKIGEVVVAFPASVAEQEMIVQNLNVMAAETQLLNSLAQQKLTALDALRASLLHHAFTGQLTDSNQHREVANA